MLETNTKLVETVSKILKAAIKLEEINTNILVTKTTIKLLETNI